MPTRAYVLLSGGIDSTTCLYLAARDFDEVVGLSVDYGQRHRKEIEAARLSCESPMVNRRPRFKGRVIAHRVLDLSAVVPQTMLTDVGSVIPNVSYDEIEGVSPAYVPFRNGLMLAAAASQIAGDRDRALKANDSSLEGLPEWALYFGAHAEDAQRWAYPDCTPEFIGGMANAIFIGTYQQLRLHTPLEWCGKADVIRLGERLNVDWSLTWSCYAGGEAHCGTCPTCRARRAGFVEAEVADPTVYLSAE